MRTVAWNEDQQALQLIDQRLLPGEFRLATYTTYQEVADAIRQMVVRGAPAIGAAAAFGLALAARQFSGGDREALLRFLEDEAAPTLKAARPTAVNLAWAVERVLAAARRAAGGVDDLREAVLSEAQRIANEDVAVNKKMAEIGATLIEDGDTIIHHCNTGALATVDWGTALGVIRMAHEQGKRIHVLVDETRPRLQGARLTAWELQQYGIPFDIISDNAAGYFLRTGQAQKVFVGADRVAANGDVANKIGTYMLALAAYDNGVPFYPVVPTSTIDLNLPSGWHILIEERDPSEVLELAFQGRRVTPEGASARNPAFDVTPARLVTAIVTEYGIVRPPYDQGLRAVVAQAQQEQKR
ncbi:MAG TPA: S-methyl-5-thioribose-1-phosphate isomerase [Anaerolineae bacterium]|nr:S-methyl-5-thioribose-1-phosphate isomerase [Anaerolineae bacterium]HID85439.1 S-methyl-5-thioribose-1-phosphate isomerase [Anaerolineales bacterium]HIQ08438.1 S-methyl-5-thioribose-1-phosphate isomerase [Anaerolineaceae bacterium]